VPQNGYSTLADDLTARVYCIRLTEAVTVQSSQVSDYTFSPESGMEQRITWSGSAADNITGIVEPECR